MDCLKKIREGAKQGLDDEKQKIEDIVKAINASGNEKMMMEMGKIMDNMKKEEWFAWRGGDAMLSSIFVGLYRRQYRRFWQY